MQVSISSLNDDVRNTDSSNLVKSKQGSKRRSIASELSDHNEHGPSQLISKIIKHEEHNVRRAKVSILVAIVLCAVAVCLVVYYLSKTSDLRTFEAEYHNFARQITELVQWEVQYNFALMQQMSAVVTSAAIMTQSTFPLVTVPHFEISGGYVDGMGGIMNLAYAPLIKAETRPKWERYAVHNQGWIAESAKLKISHPGHRDPLHGTIQDHEHDRRLLTEVENSNISGSIYRWENGVRIPEDGTDSDQLFAPIWQLSPVDESTVNVNILSDDTLGRLFKAMRFKNQSVLSEATDIGDLYDFAFDPIEKPFKKDPHSFLMEPIYSTFDSTDRELVGILVGLTSWKNLFTRLLPEGANGIYCVVTDTCGNAITFLLNGKDAEFLGYDDFHEEMLDSHRHDVKIEFYEIVNDDICSHELHIFPSATFMGLYTTSNTNVYISIFAAFVATGVFLLIYDAMVTRRQKKTMGNFAKTTKLVDSIFPKHVRDRLLDESTQEGLDTSNKTGRSVGTDVHPGDANVGVGSGLHHSRPIADLFPHTTVMFADIVGFTAWSSLREPFEVFTLLENIYGAFDTSAERYRVFKIETVGDCYVAVCGLPKPQKDHAVRMVHFADSCRHELEKTIKNLESSLGRDTRNLSMRFGLHSGSVIAGVLRGQNARFQLFGDTMNTASRMESTGERGRIQCSSETARLIKEADKASWLTPRNNKVVVKGKGEMKTFWVCSSTPLSEAETEVTPSNESSINE